MKYFKTLFLFFISAGFIMLSACSDDDDNPVTPNDKTKYDSYFPMSAGSWWIYETYDLNQDQSRNLSTLEFDSVAVTGTETIDGKTASVFSTWTEGEKQNDKYHYVEESKLYINASALLPATLPKEIDLGSELVILADFFGSTWTLKTQAIDDIDATFGDYDVTLNGTLTISGAKKGTETITVDGIDYNCQEFELSYNYAGKIKYMGYPLDINFTLKRHFFFADGKGLIQDLFESNKVSISVPIIGEIPFDIPGEEALMNTMNIGQ